MIKIYWAMKCLFGFLRVQTRTAYILKTYRSAGGNFTGLFFKQLTVHINYTNQLYVYLRSMSTHEMMSKSPDCKSHSYTVYGVSRLTDYSCSIRFVQAKFDTVSWGQ